MPLTEEKIDVIKEVLLQTVNPYLIVLFGSAAAGRMRTDSDVDIAYLSDWEIDEYQ